MSDTEKITAALVELLAQELVARGVPAAIAQDAACQAEGRLMSAVVGARAVAHKMRGER